MKNVLDNSTKSYYIKAVIGGLCIGMHEAFQRFLVEWKMSSALGYGNNRVFFCLRRKIKMNPKRRKLFQYVIPTVLASCSSFLYTIVDGIFVGQGVGTEGLGAVNLAMPYVMIITALGMLMTIGGITMTAICLGEKNESGANHVFRHALSASAGIGGILMIFGMVFATQIAWVCGANGTFLKMTSEYIFYYSMFSLPFLMSMCMQGFVRNDGAPGLVSVAVVIASVTNIALDWVLVFPFRMGIRGAAIATGLGQLVSFLILLVHFINRRGVLSFGKFKPDFRIWGEAIARGLPEMITHFGTPITTLCMNRMLLQTLGDEAVPAFSVMSYIMSFAIGLFIGVSEGVQPLFGQSYGARETESLRYYFRAGIYINMITGIVIYVLVSLFGRQICALFNPDPILADIAAGALPRFAWSFLFIALNLMISSYLYSTKRTAQAVMIAIFRCIILNTMCIVLLSAVFGGSVVWFTPGIAEVVGFFIACILLQYSEKDGIVYKEKEKLS